MSAATSPNRSFWPYLAIGIGVALPVTAVYLLTRKASKKKKKHKKPQTTSAKALASAPWTPIPLEWCRQLPKVELHAHLHGCIRDSTIEQLLMEEQQAIKESAEFKNQKETLEELQSRQQQVSTFKKGNRSLEECFQVFTLLHRLVQTEAVIMRITREAIQDFAAENVKYLELRSTPRDIASQNFTKEDYVKAVLRGIEDCRKQGLDIIVKLILSIDRTRSLKEAFDTVELARQYMDKGVVGVDFSGNPVRSAFAAFLPAFERARTVGLKTTVHVAEVWQSEQDTLDIVNFHPDRLGHGVCLSETAEKLLHASPIPIEICPTSNIKTRIASSFDQHPFGQFVQLDYPVVLCTDDCGVFSITLSSEYMNMANAFHLTRSEVFDLAFRGIDFIFSGDDVKKGLRDKFLKLKPQDLES